MKKQPEQLLRPEIRQLIDAFLEERCVKGPIAKCTATQLYKAFVSYYSGLVNTARGQSVTQTQFGRWLTAYGVPKRIGTGGYVTYMGIEPRVTEASSATTETLD